MTGDHTYHNVYYASSTELSSFTQVMLLKVTNKRKVGKGHIPLKVLVMLILDVYSQHYEIHPLHL